MTYLFFSLLVLAGTAFAFSACNKDDDGDEPFVREETKYTFIMYFQANNSLQSFLVANVNKTLEAMTESFPADARIYLFFDSKLPFSDEVDDSTSALFELFPPETKGGNATFERVKSYGDQDSTDPQFMYSVLSDVKALSPKGEYGIILSSHGSGWFPVGAGIQYQNIPGTDAAGAYEHDFNKPEGALYQTRYYGQDGTEWMNISDLVYGLSAIDFSYIMFDACFMSSIEVLYDMRYSADYMVVSPAEIMGYGFPFEKFVPMLFENSSLETRMKNVARSFYDYYALEASTSSAAIALVDMSKIDDLAESVRGVFISATNKPDVSKVQALESMAPNHAFFDLKHYMENISADSQALNRFYSALDAVVPYHANTDPVYSMYNGWFTASNVCGVSSYIPRPELPNNLNYYYNTAWASYTQPGGYPW